MIPRSRTSASSVTQGFYKPYGQPGLTGSYVASSRSMDDWTDKQKSLVTGRLPDTPMYQLNLTRYDPAIGTYKEFNSEYFEGWPLSTDKPWSEPPSIAGFDTLTYTQSAAKLLAYTNPFRYEVSVPVMVSELLEVTSLARVATKSFFSLFSSGYLNWNFGIVPFYNDMRALASITSSIEKRIREFNSLVEKGYVHRKVTLSTNSYVQEFGETPIYSGMQMVIYATRKYTWKQKISGTCTWRIRDGKKLPLDGLNDFNNAIKFALDLDLARVDAKNIVDLSTIWETIPFSWLVDYFINIGDSLKAIEESEYVYPCNISLTRECTLKQEFKPAPRSWWPAAKLTVSPGLREWKLKRRLIIGDDPQFRDLLSFGFLNKNQALNLVALIGVLKR